MAKPDPKSKTPAAPAVDAQVTHLVVHAKRDGFRRAGRAWSATPTVVKVDEFTEEQIAQLLGESQLVVLPSVREPAVAATEAK